MSKSLVVGVGAVGAVAVSMALFGSGVATANDEYVGQTFADAAQAIGDNGQSVTIATKVGSFLPTEQCTVTGSRTANFPDSSGNRSSDRVLLNLNCNNTFAAAGVPGNSIGSPEGRQARSAFEDQLAELQAQAQQNQADELLQSGEVPGEAGQVPTG